MQIKQASVAGTMESSDIMIQVTPASGGIELELESAVLQIYGDDIRNAILDVAQRLGVTGAHIKGVDKGALECTIRARTETALLRAMGEVESNA